MTQINGGKEIGLTPMLCRSTNPYMLELTSLKSMEENNVVMELRKSNSKETEVLGKTHKILLLKSLKITQKVTSTVLHMNTWLWPLHQQEPMNQPMETA
jgi:hypothetical protein